MTDNTPLSFVELTRRLNAMPDYDSGSPQSSSRAKLGICISLVAYLISLLVQHLPIPERTQLYVLLGLLAFEVVGVCMNIWCSRREFYSLREPLNDFAKQLDHDYPHHFALIEWLAAQPADRLQRHAAMTRFRRERITQKLPLVAGGIASLGIVPVAVAIYLQAREYIAGRPLSYVDIIAGLVIGFMYVLSWMSALMKARIESMDMYLQEAIASQVATA